MIRLCDILLSYNPDTNFGYMCNVTLTLEIWPWVEVVTHPSVTDNKCVKYHTNTNRQLGVTARTGIFGMCALWPWSWRFMNGSRSWHTLCSWTISVWNIIQIRHRNEELWPGHRFLVYVHCDLDLGDMTFGQCHGKPFGHGQWVYKISSRSN